jgi:hypothetical protein
MAREPRRSRTGHLRPKDRFFDAHRSKIQTVAIAGGAVLLAVAVAKLALNAV